MPVDIHPEKAFRRRADPHPAACGRQVLQQELPVLRRPARRRRVGGERAVERVEVVDQARRHEYRWLRARRPRHRRWRGRPGAARRTPAPRALLAGPEVFRYAEALAAAPAHVLRAKAVLCPGLNVKLWDEASGERVEWLLRRRPARLSAVDAEGSRVLPPDLFTGVLKKDHRCRRLGVVLDARGRTDPGKLRQPDSDRATRHPRRMACARA
jgi:hypothetical protein